MTLGKLQIGDPFFVGITDDYLDHHVDENSQQIMAKHLSEVVACLVNDEQEFKSTGRIYVCIPVGTVNKGLKLDGRFECLARAAAALGDAPLQE